MKVLTSLLLLTAPSAFSQYGGQADLDRAIAGAIAAGQIPGAVVEIGGPSGHVFRKAYGRRALVPRPEAMTVDTIFDAASLTKVVATGTSLMRLVEQGRVRLNDPVTVYLPEFQGGKSTVTVRQLATHFSGLRPDVDLEPAWSGYGTGIRLALTDRPRSLPGARFVYSDINYILLGEIVHKVTGSRIDEYTAAEVFGPLGMRDTRYRPPAEWRPRIAPTEVLKGQTAPLRGVVHDPTTRFMDGVAGHAGMFTTAADLGRYARMILNGGTLDGKTVLQPLSVRKFTEPASPRDHTVLRGIAWDIDSPFSANRGELFPLGSFGHTGFTGTSLWIDPVSKTYVVLMTNAIHPKVKAAISSLRSRVATIAAANAGIRDAGGLALTGYNETMVGSRRPAARNGEVLTGLDVLAEGRFERFRGRRIGLITNHTGIDREGRRNIDVMLAAGVKIQAIFSPEHGISGRQDIEEVADEKDAATGLPIYSMYNGPQRRLPVDRLAEVDLLVFDIQDIGSRFYTYMCTLFNAMEQAAKMNLEIVVLDRPNPINGVAVEGPMLDRELASFVGCLRLPVRHGMTIGELARLANAENKWGAKLDVVAMKGWQRGDWWDSTGLRWVDPSPNMRSLVAAILFPGVALLEYEKLYSVGRGTDLPFEQIGAQWMDGRRMAAYLNGLAFPGIRAYPVRFKPESSRFANTAIDGIRLVVTDRDVFEPVRFGLELAAAIQQLYPGRLNIRDNAKLIGSERVMKSLLDGEPARTIVNQYLPALEEFVERRKAFLLY